MNNSYISVEKLESGETRIEILPVSKKHNTFKIYFNEVNGASKFLEHTNSKYETLCNLRFIRDEANSNSTLIIAFDTEVDCLVEPKYTASLDNSTWTETHIDDIKNQLEEQVKTIEDEIATKKELVNIEYIIRKRGYATIIQKLIMEHSDELTDEQVMDIQRTLTQVKEEKGLISHS